MVQSEHYETSKIGRFTKIVNDCKLLNIFAKHSVIDVYRGSEYTSAKNVFF